MARYLIVLVVVVALAAGWYRFTTEEPASQETTESTLRSAAESQTKTEILDELDVRSARRALSVAACRQPAERSAKEIMAEYEAQGEAMLRVLGASTDAEHLLVAALISWRKSPEKALVLLGQAESADPRNSLIASQILELCLEIDACIRARPEMERNLIVADKANGIAWVTVARSRLSRADEAGALAALRQAAAAPSMEDHFADHVLLFERALAASSDLPPFERSIAAHGHGAAVFTASFLIAGDCEERALNSAEWRDACLRLGERFEHGGRTLLTQAIGLGMQSKMYEYGGDSRAQEVVERRNQQHREELTRIESRTNRALELKDATVMRQYLDRFVASGEMAAMQFLAAEIEARLPPLDEQRESACPTP
jgi:hypothetical protein